MTHDQRAQRAVLDYLRADNGGPQQRPKRRRYHSSMYRREDREGVRALLEECTGGQDLEHESQEVEGKEDAELGSADGRLATAGDPGEVGNKEDAEAAGDDVGDVGDRTICAGESDATLGIHANGSGFWVCRKPL